MGWRWSLKRRVVRTHDTSVCVQKLCMLIYRLINCHGFISNDEDNNNETMALEQVLLQADVLL